LYKETWQKFEEQFGVRVSNFYGLTETITGGIYCGPDDNTYKLGTMGKPVDCQVKIMNENKEAGPGEIGEILMTGNHIMEGYFNAPKLNEEILKDGWLYTGDLGKYDKDGFFYIEGRKKHIIITGGVNVMNAEVEEVLLSIDGVKDAVVLGEEDDTWGEIVVAAVVLLPKKKLSEMDIIETCRKSLEQVKLPRKVYFIDEIPRTKSGKAIMDQTREIITSLTVDEADSLSGSLEERIIKVASESFKLNPESLSLDTDNRDLDEWDSLSHLVFVSNLESEFNIRFATVEIMKIDSLKSAYHIISEK
jgi:long-chain acyl-CoA synthetase